jgi:hypothetical protein
MVSCMEGDVYCQNLQVVVDSEQTLGNAGQLERTTNPVARGFIPARLRSSRKPVGSIWLLHCGVCLGAASQPSGDKSPRHRSSYALANI